MWTKNGKKLFIKQLNTYYTNTSGNASDFLMKTCLGNDVEVGNNRIITGVFSNLSYMKYDMTQSQSTSSDYNAKWQLFLGTGTTPPTEDDIILESPVTFTCPVLPQVSRGDNYTTLLIAYTFTNNTDTTQTITEIGLCSYLGYSTSGNEAILFNRRLLENPVTMEAGESKVFTFTIDTSNLQE